MHKFPRAKLLLSLDRKGRGAEETSSWHKPHVYPQRTSHSPLHCFCPSAGVTASPATLSLTHQPPPSEPRHTPFPMCLDTFTAGSSPFRSQLWPHILWKALPDHSISGLNHPNSEDKICKGKLGAPSPLRHFLYHYAVFLFGTLLTST